MSAAKRKGAPSSARREPAPYRARIQRGQRAEAIQGELHEASMSIESARRVVFGEPLKDHHLAAAARARATPPAPMSKKTAATIERILCHHVPRRRRAALLEKALQQASMWAEAARKLAQGENFSDIGAELIGLVPRKSGDA